MTAPEVTVVTVTRNDLDGLRATLASVRAQTLGAVEHVIVDGASTDGSADWARAHPAVPQSIVLSEKDDGTYHAMNKGLALATGGLVTFLNSGDTYAAADVLERAVAHRREFDWQWGHGRARVVDVHGRQLRPLAPVRQGRLRHVFGRNVIVHQTVFVATDLLREIGGFDTDLAIAADFRMALQLRRVAAPGVWPDVDVEYLAGGSSDAHYMQSLWQMHLARCDVYSCSTLARSLDAAWTAALCAYVLARRTAKRVAAAVLGTASVDRWAGSRA